MVTWRDLVARGMAILAKAIPMQVPIVAISQFSDHQAGDSNPRPPGQEVFAEGSWPPVTLQINMFFIKMPN